MYDLLKAMIHTCSTFGWFFYFFPFDILPLQSVLWDHELDYAS